MTCSKVKYDTAIEAENALEELHVKFRKHHKQPVRYYKCDNCKCYHLTSRNGNTRDVKLKHKNDFKRFM